MVAALERKILELSKANHKFVDWDLGVDCYSISRPMFIGRFPNRIPVDYKYFEKRIGQAFKCPDIYLLPNKG